jgi:cyclic lactone autoinducer peptide
MRGVALLMRVKVLKSVAYIVGFFALFTASSASLIFWYQPKVPKILRK